MEMVRCGSCNTEMDATAAGYDICEKCDAEFNGVDEDTMEEAVQTLFENIAWKTVDPEWGIEGEVRSVRNFREAHLLTHNRGIVIAMENGEEFQIEIKRSK